MGEGVSMPLSSDADDPVMELARALDAAIEERNKAYRLLQRYVDAHCRTIPHAKGELVICECLICVDTRFTLAGVRVSGT